MHDPESDLASQMELRDELLIACREVLAKIGTSEASVLVREIEDVLDLDEY